MGRGGGSHSGGGHSGGRSFGGRSGGFGGSRGPGGSGFGGPGFGGPLPGGPHFRGPRRRWGGPVFHWGLPGWGGSGRRGGVGCFSLIILLIVFIGFFSQFTSNNSSSHNSEIAVSRTERTPVSGTSACADWYLDELGFIDHDTNLTDGLKYFYSQTGIQPYVVLLKYDPSIWINGEWNENAAEEYLAQMYNETFSDNGHLIFAYFACENDSKDMNGTFYLYYGSAAYSIMDAEAETIFWSYFDMNYNNLDLSIAEFIGQTFRQTADNIMHISTGGNNTLATMSVVFAVICVAVIIAGIIVFKKINKKEKSI